MNYVNQTILNVLLKLNPKVKLLNQNMGKLIFLTIDLRMESKSNCKRIVKQSFLFAVQCGSPIRSLKNSKILILHFQIIG